MGRLFQVTGPTTNNRFLYDGDDDENQDHVGHGPFSFMVAEYACPDPCGGDNAGTLSRRYVHSDNVDDPVVQYSGSNVGSAYRTFLMPDERGSVTGLIDNAGTTVTKNSYDEYGIPGSANQGRFQYTGQAWLPELGCYHYKARIYCPTLGRFLQVDPVGWDDQINMYAYVGSDPVNATDPSGLCGTSKETPAAEKCQDPSNLKVSPQGKDFIKRSEGTESTVYKDSGGLPTVGVGHLVTAKDNLKVGDKISDGKIESLFGTDLGKAEAGIRNVVGDLPLSQNEFDAMTDLVFNVGEARLNSENSPGLNAAIEKGDYKEISNQIRYTRDASGNSPRGLIIRNDERQRIFREGH